MNTNLGLRLAQHQTLTPQLLQSIRLLQLSSLELNQEVEQALSDNPLLEREDDPMAGHLRLGADGAVLAPAPAPAPGEGEASPSEGGGETEAGETEAGEAGTWGAGGPAPADDDDGPRDWATAAPGLREHLRGQLAATCVTPRDRALVAMLIDAVDESGYLGVGIAELVELCAADAPVEADELLTALRLLQSFDPPGVAARSPGECMHLQIEQRLRAQPAPDPARSAALRLALRIVDRHLELLAARDFPRLRRLLGADEQDLRAAQQIILGLNPRPGVGFGSSTPDYIVPDILVRRSGGRWVARLNPEVRPRLRVNQAYAAILKRETGRAAARSRPAASAGDWSGRLADARVLIANLRQRFRTIEEVAQAIVERQSRFFSHGEIAMRPLVLREIAATLGLNESTVSRATANKYMATPFGVFELRYFFNSHLATEAGGEASSTAIRALIRQFIEAEDARQPLSDSRIAAMLGAQGLKVARRTVAKYRDLLRLAPASLRKSI
jgi:RNA polymerase sigma-54 factor